MDFSEYAFYISKIGLCVKTTSDAVKKLHRDHLFHTLLYQCEGSTRYRFPNREQVCIKAGQVLYLPKSADCEAEPVETGSAIAIHFDLTDADADFAFFTLPAELGVRYASKFERMQFLWDSRSVGSESALLSILYDVICAIQRSWQKLYVDNSQKQLVLAGHRFLMEHLTDPALCVGQIAAHLSVTPEYFRKLFKAAYHTSPRQYLIQKRVELSKTLLASGECKLSQIWQRCGFSSHAFFCTTFKSVTAQTPSGYEKSLRETNDA